MEDAMLLALKMEEGATYQGDLQKLEKARNLILTKNLQKEQNPVDTLILAQ